MQSAVCQCRVCGGSGFGLTLATPGHVSLIVSDHAGDRLSVLASHGLVERISRGLYRLTDAGHAYLDGRLDAAGLEADT